MIEYKLFATKAIRFIGNITKRDDLLNTTHIISFRFPIINNQYKNKFKTDYKTPTHI